MPPDTTTAQPQTDTAEALFRASYAGDIRTAIRLLDRGVPLNISEEATGLMPLHIAIGRNYLELVRLYLSRGADIVPDRRGRWPSTIAELCEADEEICDLIVDAEVAKGDV